MNEYATLSQLRTQLALASQNTGDDNELRRLLSNASRAIDRYTRRIFYPRRHQGNNTFKFDLPPKRDQLHFNFDILEVKGLSDYNGASEIDSSVYWLKTGDMWNIAPYDRIIIDDSSGSLFNFSGTRLRAVHMDAVEGFHENYGDAWIDSGGSLTDALGSAITLASTSGSEAFDSIGRSPRFSEGQIWKLGSGGSEEYVYVKDTINTSSVRLIRGINGTSAVAHAASTTIQIWDVEPDIAFSTRELAQFMYQKSKNPFTNTLANLQMGILEMPNTWPEQTFDRLQRFRKSLVHSF